MYFQLPQTNWIPLLMALRYKQVLLDFYHMSAHTGTEPSKSQPNVMHQGARLYDKSGAQAHLHLDAPFKSANSDGSCSHLIDSVYK